MSTRDGELVNDPGQMTPVEPAGDATPADAGDSRLPDIYCPGCNYSLRGLESDRCPECGLDVSDVKRRVSRIPWVHRAEIGRVRAYWKMVWMVSTRFKELCNEIGVPAHAADAKLFRWVTIPIAFLPLVGVAVAVMADPAQRGAGSVGDLLLYLSLGLAAVLSCIVLLTAIPYYALRHRELDVELQHRAAVLCLYAASANMAWIFVVAILLIVGLMIQARDPLGLTSAIIFLVTGMLFVALIGLTASDVLQVVKKTLKSSKASFWISLKVGLFCVGGVLLGLFGVPVSIMFILIVYYSLI